MSQRTINLLIAALGGEGGGVLTNWLIEIADRSGWHCQSTSLAGVAQRTGATIYYLEFMPRTDGAQQPVMSLFPAQGDIDIAVTSEIAEAGRMLSRGFVSPDRTTLISSDHRVYGITEKSAVGDGAIDPALIIELAGRYAQRFIHFDIAELVGRHGTVISAGLLGAIAGSGALPFEREVFLELIAQGKGAEANRRAFLESFDVAASGGVRTVEPEVEPAFTLPEPTTAVGRELLPRIAALPEAVQEVVYHGVQRLLAYQDADYARDYLERVERLQGVDDGSDDNYLTREGARWLALWMAYEDIPRVAQLKLRPGREAEIRNEVLAEVDQPIQVTEFFHPRVEEVAAVLPVAWGRRLLASRGPRRVLEKFLGPRKLRTDTVWVSLVLRFLAGLARFRRGSYGFAEESRLIERWFNTVLGAETPELARALVDCGRLVKGYGDTRARTTSRLMAILDCVERGVTEPAVAVNRLRQAALDSAEDEPFAGELAAIYSGPTEALQQ